MYGAVIKCCRDIILSIQWAVSYTHLDVYKRQVTQNYFPAVEKSLQECVQKGPLAAQPVGGVKATLYDGSYHPVDSSEMAFKMATILAFKKGFMEASPVLLEPIVSMKVTVPDKYTGDVMGDLNKRRGRVLGMNPCLLYTSRCV